MDQIKIHEKYQPLWNSQASYYILTGGRGSGKSFAVSDFIENLTFEKGHTILFTRYTLTSAHISIIPEFEEKIEIEGHIGLFDINKTEIENKTTESKILFRGIRTSSGNQTANLKSIQNVTTWVLDEAEELTDENTFDKIDESVRKIGIQNRIIIVLNPTTKEHWIYKRFFEEAGVKPGWNGVKEDVCYIHTTYIDNIKNLSKKFIDKVKKLKLTNPTKYLHRILGGWLDAAEGVIFDNWSYGKFDYSLPHGYGMDFGFFPDPDVIVKVAIDSKRKKIYCKKVLKLNNAGTNKLISEINNNIKDKKLIIADCAEPRLISDIKAKGIRIQAVKKGSGSVLAGIKTMQDYEIIVDEDSTEIGTELNNYVWSDKKSGIPVDAYNHWIDAIRYYVSTNVSSTKKYTW
ncbi:MAG: PBSX family phage terminase large subunit [Eubacteriaceae bacterium]